MGRIHYNVTAFIHEVTDYGENTLKTEYRRLIRAAVGLMVAAAVYACPVRKGDLRGSCQIGLGRPNTKKGERDPDGSKTIARASRALAGAFDPYQDIHMNFNEFYASYVNYGTDKVTGRLFMERGILEFEKVVDG